MDHLPEELIERYLLEPDRISPPELERVYAHLKDCPQCRSVHDFLKDFHARLLEASRAEGNMDESGSRANSSFGRPVVLHPIRDVPDIALEPGARITVLAAETSPANAHRFTTKAALVSEKDKLLLRIVHDRVENRYRMYLIAEDAARTRGTRVSIPALGVDLTTNEHGVAEFVLSASREEPDWATVQAVVAT